MFIAINSDGNRVDSCDANKNVTYFCPICCQEVQLKKGEVNTPHFAHLKCSCLDTWNYDMSQWHKKMQNYFPQKFREVIVKYNNRKHRADILINNIVIEFQHSPISITEFNERNDFFKKAGYQLAWVFDLSEQYENESLYCKEQRNLDYLMHWKHPKRIFSDIKLCDHDKNFALWFAHKSKNSDLILLDKVIWSPTNEYGKRSVNRFIVSQYTKAIGYNFDPHTLFYSKRENFKEILRKVKKELDCKIKYKGVKGHRANEYTCERRKNFGIKLSSENGCFYCKYCGMVLMKKRENKTEWAVYCSYPNQARETCNNLHPGYECDKVDVYGI